MPRPDHPATISCLTVTRAARLPLLARALGDYACQTHAARELVIVHDDGPACTAAIMELATRCGARDVVIHAAPAGTPLGALRNLARERASGTLVCQWDDDDRYHPARLALQCAALVDDGADASFLTDQLHWFTGARLMYWVDWRREPYPLDFVQGTMLARRDALPRYPELALGEDTALCRALLATGARIARLDDHGWCYVYVCHGGNAWSEAHHWAIAQAKALAPARFIARAPVALPRLAEYAPPPGVATLDPAGRFLRMG